MKKRQKKNLIYFGITFLVVLVIGTIGLTVYKKAADRKAEENGVRETLAGNMLSEEGLQEIETDQDAEAGTPGPDDPETEDDAATQDTENAGDDVSLQGDDDASLQGEDDATGSVVLAFGGDVCFHDEYANMCSLRQRGGKIESCIAPELLTQMRAADICMVNNEFSYSDRGTPIEGKAFTFRSKPENVKLLTDMGVDIVSLANNHAYDYGKDALLDSLEILENEKVRYVGAGRNLEEASQPVYFEVNSVRIGIVSATQIERMDHPDTKGATETEPGVLRCFSQQELDHFLSVVTQAKQQCDFLIAFLHWGTENTDELDWAQPYQADLISKAGADLIVGAHPHCLQGIDSVNGVPVIYSLGNYWFNSKALDTALLKVVVTAEKVESVQILPARQENCSTSMLQDAEKQRVLDYLQGLSPNVTIDADGFVGW